jgi:ABC-type transporter Mla subunit MlaD
VTGDGQTTLAEWGDDPAGRDAEDMAGRLDALRQDLDRLMALVDTLTESQQDLADAVDGTLAERGDAVEGVLGEDAADRATVGRGFQ